MTIVHSAVGAINESGVTRRSFKMLHHWICSALRLKHVEKNGRNPSSLQSTKVGEKEMENAMKECWILSSKEEVIEEAVIREASKVSKLGTIGWIYGPQW